MKKPQYLIVLLFAVMLLVAGGSLLLGKYPATLAEMLQALIGGGVPTDARQQVMSSIVHDIRLPRIAAALLIGAALAAAGTAYQAMFMNPLVSPGILGVLAGAGFGAALGIVLKLNIPGVQLTSLLGGLGAVTAALAIARAYQGDRLLMLILGGIISGAFFTAMLSLIKYAADPNDELPAITYWLMGSLSAARRADILAALPFFVLGLGTLLAGGKALNILSLGEEAATLGINPHRQRMVMITAATLVSVAAVALGGIIGWLGLIVPHLGRLLVGPDNRVLLPVSALLGAILLMLADDLSRSVFTVEVPLGITTSVFGIPLFVIFLKRTRRGCR